MLHTGDSFLDLPWGGFWREKWGRGGKPAKKNKAGCGGVGRNNLRNSPISWQ